MVTTDADAYDTVGGDDLQQGAPPQAPSTGFTLKDLTFRMYARKDFTSYKTGQYLGTAFTDSSYGVKRTDLGGGKILFGVDDRSFFSDNSVNAGNLDYRDIRFTVQLQDNYITQIEFIGSDNGTGSSYEEFKFQVWLADEMLSDDFYRDVGMVVGADTNSGGSGGAGSGGTSSSANSHSGSLNDLAAIKAFDYGLNKGTYQIYDRDVESIDLRRILIFDYGKSVANYTNKAPDVWSLYFTAPETLWMASDLNKSFLKQDETWLNYTALRHFGKANVLFCDGHIETLSADDLIETSPLWGEYGW
jgi:prepilin-type processing-associated H-X9-DG protein